MVSIKYEEMSMYVTVEIKFKKAKKKTRQSSLILARYSSYLLVICDFKKSRLYAQTQTLIQALDIKNECEKEKKNL